MHSRYALTAAATIVLLVGMLLGSMVNNQPALAQGRQQFGAGRFQLSSYASAIGDDVHHGCYILDTSTGQVFHAALGSNAEKVADRLP